jgi:hypothetical protein
MVMTSLREKAVICFPQGRLGSLSMFTMQEMQERQNALSSSRKPSHVMVW